MSTTVAEIELTAPLPSIPLRPGAGGALILVRAYGRPRGLLHLAGRGVIAPAQIQGALTLAGLGPGAPPAPLPAAPVSSVVVCTHERPDDLERCLRALLPIAARGHEVIVVDNAPRSGRTAAVAAGFPYRYRCEPRAGLDNARNAGLRAASHPIVAFTDDDAAPDPAWLDALAAPFADPAVGCATGLVLPLELETPAQELFERYCAHRRTFARRELAAPATPPAAAGVAGMGANMALRRALALRLGGFDPRLDAGTPTCSGGDTDMFARVLDAGARIVYAPEALVWHRHRRDAAALRECLFGYGVGLYSVLTKRLVEGRDPQAALIAARWLLGPPLKALLRRLRGSRAMPVGLLALEACGALLGPLRFAQAHRRLAASAGPAGCPLEEQAARKGEVSFGNPDS